MRRASSWPAAEEFICPCPWGDLGVDQAQEGEQEIRAVVLYEHGGMANFIYEENYRDPECGSDDVIVAVKACSLNYHDLFTRNGMPGITLDLPRICGLDAAGNIAEVGANVTD